jgi:sodium-dependent dicarboxylate transporter 2/3/5
VILWISPGLVKAIAPESVLYTFLKSHFPMGIVALLASLILFILPDENGDHNVTWNDAKLIDWGTIMIFGGGLAMGSILDKSGLAAQFGSILFAGGLDNLMFTGITAIAAGILISEFSSNTASTAIIVPILLGTFAGIDPSAAKMLVIACAFGASFGFMLPVSTPPNAIVYGTGKLPLKHMIKTGVFFDITGFAIIFLFVVVLFPKLGLI